MSWIIDILNSISEKNKDSENTIEPAPLYLELEYPDYFTNNEPEDDDNKNKTVIIIDI